jgi:hypothetical protein
LNDYYPLNDKDADYTLVSKKFMPVAKCEAYGLTADIQADKEYLQGTYFKDRNLLLDAFKIMLDLGLNVFKIPFN